MRQAESCRLRRIAHLCHEVADFFGRILQVGVECDHDLPARRFKTGEDGHVLAIVTVEQDDARDVGALAELFRQDGHRIVAAAIVDEDDLVACLQGVEGWIQAGEQGGQAILLVVDRNDNGQFRFHRRAAHLMRMDLTVATARSTSCVVMA